MLRSVLAMATTTVTTTSGATTPAGRAHDHGPDHGRTGWALQNARAELVREVLAQEATTRDGTLGWDTVAGSSEVFETPGDLLRALHQQWLTRLTARLDSVLELGGDDLVGEIVAARAALADQDPSLARILDRHESDPALAVAQRTERRVLAVAAGLASLAEPAEVAAARGARLAGPRLVGPRAAGPRRARGGRGARSVGVASCTVNRLPGLRLLSRAVRHHAAPAA